MLSWKGHSMGAGRLASASSRMSRETRGEMPRANLKSTNRRRRSAEIVTSALLRDAIGRSARSTDPYSSCQVAATAGRASQPHLSAAQSDSRATHLTLRRQPNVPRVCGRCSPLIRCSVRGVRPDWASCSIRSQALWCSMRPSCSPLVDFRLQLNHGITPSDDGPLAAVRAFLDE